MKPTLLSVIALSAIMVAPALAQQAEDPFVPGANFMANWDANEDGTITLEELLERRADVFLAFDSDENGILDADEFQMLDEARANASQRPNGHGNGASAGQGEQLLSRAATDTDGNGEISKEEFLAASEAWMGFMDRNKDAVVNQADFGQGRGNRQVGAQGMGQGQGRGQGFAQGGGQGSGQGKEQNWQGRMPGQPHAMQGQGGQGRGHGKGYSHGQGWHGAMQPPQQDMSGQYGYGKGQGKSRAQQGMMQGQPGQMGPGLGKQGGQGRGQGQPAIAFEAFPTQDGGLWFVDMHSGDILFCKSVADSNAVAGFTPVCKEADL